MANGTQDLMAIEWLQNSHRILREEKCMELVRWANHPTEAITPQIDRQVVGGKQGTLARFFFKTGTHISCHKHESEQFTCVLRGALRIRISGEEADEMLVRDQEVLLIPGGIKHEVWALEDSIVLDFFAPPRDDWRIDGDDYLKGKR